MSSSAVTTNRSEERILKLFTSCVCVWGRTCHNQSIRGEDTETHADAAEGCADVWSQPIDPRRGY